MFKQLSALLPIVLLLVAVPAHADDNKLTINVGSDYSRGKYGSNQETTTWAFPVMLKYEQDVLTWKLSVPYIRSKGPSNVVGTGADRVVTGGPGVVRTETGWGDMVGSLSWAFYQNAAARSGLDLVGKVKLATGDKNEGLSTGENDYSLQLDGYKAFGDTTAFATAGKKFMGEPTGIRYRDPWYGSLGASYRQSPATSWGGTLDWRDRVTAGGAAVREGMLFVSHRFTPQYKAQLYMVKGFSDASPDFGAGLMLACNF